MQRFALSLLLSFLAVSGQRSPDPWTGIWKIDTTRGQLTGDTFTYLKVADRTWKVSSGGAVTFTFREDGKDYPTTDPENTVAVTRIDTRSWHLSRRSHGKVWDEVEEQISPDGNTLTSIDHEALDDGSANVVTTTYTRTAPGQDFAGKWRSIRLSGPHINWIFPFSYEMKRADAHQIRWEIPSYHLTLEGKDDGTPILLTPPQERPATTVTVTRRSQREFSVAILEDTKTVRRETFVLARDGRSFSEDSLDPDKPNEVRTAIFVKQ